MRGKRGAVAIIFTLVAAILILFMVRGFYTGIAEAKPDQEALTDFHQMAQFICNEPGSDVSRSLGLKLLRLDGSGNPRFMKLHLGQGQVELFVCIDPGAGCSRPIDKPDIRLLDCPADIKYDDCWISAPKETTAVTIKKVSNLLTIEEKEGVNCD